MSYVLGFFDKDGNARPPENWEEVRKMFCNRWDSCSPCLYAGGYARDCGGFECTHPLHPKRGVANANQIKEQ